VYELIQKKQGKSASLEPLFEYLSFVVDSYGQKSALLENIHLDFFLKFLNPDPGQKTFQI